MKYKRLLKFYFNVDGINGALDSLLLRYATASADCYNGCEYYADRMCRVIQVKSDLGELWAFLDNALSSVTEQDRRTLESYSEKRRKERKGTILSEGTEEESVEKRALHRSLMKFSRRVSGRIKSFERQISVLQEYYCLVFAPGEKEG